MSAPWRIEDDPPGWLTASAREVDSLREWCRKLEVREVHLTDDVIDLDSGTFESVDTTDANPPRDAITRALRQLDTRHVETAEANRDRSAEASEEIRRRFGGDTSSR